MKAKYILGSLIVLPLLPLMYFQGKKIRASVPKLPEAKNPEGFEDIGSPITKRILLIGESTFAGVGVESHDEGFCGTFAKELSQSLNKNIHWEVLAKSGYTAKRVGTKLLPKIRAHKLDLIVIGLGGNDAFTLNSPAKWKKDVFQLFKSLKIKFPLTPIFFANMPPIKEFPAFTKTIKFVVGNLVEMLGQELKFLARQEDLVFYNDEIISITNWSRRYQLNADINDYFSDGVHPSKLTYQTWAKDFATFVSNTLTT